jgi:hypothetical protein
MTPTLDTLSHAINQLLRELSDARDAAAQGEVLQVLGILAGFEFRAADVAACIRILAYEQRDAADAPRV